MSIERSKIRRLWLLPVVVALVPVCATLLAAAVAMNAATVPSCIPFIEGCTSVSATGRNPPSSFIFKGVLMPSSVLIAVYWLLNAVWLRSLDTNTGKLPASIASFGIAGSIFLVVYLAFLGSQGELYELMRRYGIYFFFLFTVVAQLLLAVGIRRTLPALKRIANFQLAACGVMLALGALNLVLKQWLIDPDKAENIIEWNFALVMFLNFGLVGSAWHRTELQLDIRVRN